MQPDERRRGKTQQGISRARILMKKHLGWLPGFPVAVENDSTDWWCMPPGAGSPEIVSIDRERLRRKEMAVTKLHYRFPKALPKIVENVDDWLARMGHLLVVLKDSIHNQRGIDAESWLGGEILPGRWADGFRKLRGKHAPLRPFLDAVLFLETTGPKRPDLESLDWIDRHAASLARLSTPPAACGAEKALELQLLLFLMRGEMHPAFLSVMFESLVAESVWSLPKDDVRGYAEKLSKQFKLAANLNPFQIPDRTESESVGEALSRLLPNLAQWKPKSRRYATEILSLLIPGDFAARVGKLKTQVKSEESRLLGALLKLQREPADKFRKKARKKQINASAKVVVDEDGLRMLKNVRRGVEHVVKLSSSTSRIETWIRFLTCLGEYDADLRAGIFVRWGEMASSPHGDGWMERGFAHILSQLGNLIAQRGLSPVLLRHWRQFSRSDGRGNEFIRYTLFEEASLKTYTRAIRLLEELLYDRGLELKSKLLCSLVEFAVAIPNGDRAVGILSILAGRQEGEHSYWEDAIRAAVSATDDDDKAAEIMRILDDDYELVEHVRLLGTRIRDDRLRAIVERSILEKNKKLLLSLAACTKLVVDLGFDVPEIPDFGGPPVWIERYPSALHEPLRQLGRIAEEAEAIAESLLRKDFPREADLRREIAALQERLTRTDDEETCRRIEKRLENLAERIESPRPATEKRLANLARRIQTRVDHQIVAKYQQDGYDRVARQLKSEYGVDRLPEEVFKPPYDRLLAGVLRLKGGTRKLGLRLLLSCAGNTTADFSSQPSNVAFLDKMQTKGFNAEPWTSENFELWAKTGSEEAYRLFFARDILDYLMMGFHFDTCLSPGNCNFFSTIANAVDANKQVVYGKTAAGRVIGRCLFALTDSGTILTYHRYSHDPADDFDEAVNRFATKLAEDMNTRLTSSGTVSKLVAADWYDDGAVRTESALDIQAADGAVRTFLRTAEPHSVIDGLRKILGTDRILRSLLGSLLFVDEFTQRPELVRPFVDTYGFDEGLEFNEKFRLAILAHVADLPESAEAILVSLHPNTLPQRLRRTVCDFCDTFHNVGSHGEVFDLLIAYSPTLALRTIRATRPSHMRRDADETEPARRRTLAEIHRTLGRDRLAAKLASGDSRS